MNRCPWSDSDDLYRSYHDTEWGTPVHDEKKHFEFLLLETMQAGLSWHLILSKREHYRKAFDKFNWKKIMLYDAQKIDELMTAEGLIHNRKKLESAVKNAVVFEKVRKEFGSFDSYIWSFTNGKTIWSKKKTMADIPTKTELSDTVSLDMKKRGFSFVGSVTIYSHLQAIGVINDHLVSCFRYKELRNP
jgi:DNA-3-methyladenine glycosylase I